MRLAIKQKKAIAFVGIDFGTSTTKVAYNVIGKGQVVPLLFGHRLSGIQYPDYCLPSLIGFDANGRLVCGVDAARIAERSPDRAISRLKMVLAGRHAEEFKDADTDFAYSDVFNRCWCEGSAPSPEIVTAVFLWDVMNQSREKVAECLKTSVNDLDIYFQICMPIHHLKLKEVRDAFEQVLAVTQRLDVDSHRLRRRGKVNYENLLARASRFWCKEKYDPNAEATRVFFIPETIAQIASYRFSAARQRGLHVLIDIGAGTTDITVLNLRHVRTAMEVLDCYAWVNTPLGTGAVERQLRAYYTRRGRQLTNDLLFESMARRQVDEELSAHIKKGLFEIRERARPVLGEGYQYGLRAAGLGMRDWERGNLQVLLGGGGSLISFTRETFTDLPIYAQESVPWGPHPVRPIPEPPRTYAENGAPFCRMAVAYGLALQEEMKFNLEPTFNPSPFRRPIRYNPETDYGLNWGN